MAQVPSNQTGLRRLLPSGLFCDLLRCKQLSASCSCSVCTSTLRRRPPVSQPLQRQHNSLVCELTQRTPQSCQTTRQHPPSLQGLTRSVRAPALAAPFDSDPWVIQVVLTTDTPHNHAPVVLLLLSNRCVVDCSSALLGSVDPHTQPRLLVLLLACTAHKCTLPRYMGPHGAPHNKTPYAHCKGSTGRKGLATHNPKETIAWTEQPWCLAADTRMHTLHGPGLHLVTACDPAAVVLDCHPEATLAWVGHLQVQCRQLH